MPKVHLTQQFADNPPIVKNKPKMDYFDTLVPGFLLEVRSTGNRYFPHIKVYKRSWNMDKAMIERQILPRWGNARISEIIKQDIQDFQAGFILKTLISTPVWIS